MSRLSLRVRLALLIGLMLVVLGAALLAISYGLVSSNLSAPLPAAKEAMAQEAAEAPAEPGAVAAPQRAAKEAAAALHPAPPRPKPTGRLPLGVSPTRAAKVAAAQGAQNKLRNRTLDQLVTEYLAILAGIVLAAVVLGWLLAGRLLRSVRRITSVAERVTGRNLDERVGLEGPRDELRELGDAFDGMLARLDAVLSGQRRFVADASHELRTPLAAMRAEIEVLAADPHAAAADVEAATLVLRRQLARSEQLIEALLALARSEPELLNREQVDLAQLADEALADDAVDAAVRGLRVDAQLAPAVVYGDRRLLTLLVGNLLGNAIKHNRDDGWVELQTAVDADKAQLVIANTGVSVAADEVRDLTQAFRRGGRARVGDGHGLGLAIVAAVARAHAGTIRIAPRAEGGLLVQVSVPLACDGMPGTPAPHHADGTRGAASAST